MSSKAIFRRLKGRGSWLSASVLDGSIRVPVEGDWPEGAVEGSSIGPVCLGVGSTGPAVEEDR
jgi:hypothetical protein